MVSVAKTEISLRDFVVSRMHRAYTAVCDDLRALGYMSTEERLGLSSAIGDTLQVLTEKMDTVAAAASLLTPDDLRLLLGKRIEKKAIPYKKTPLAGADEAWDGGAEVAAAEVDDLKVMCAIVQGDGEKKGDYKLPHHKADGHACVLKGVMAAGAVLQGARGGVDASDAEIAGAKKHLAKHYAEFDRTAPWDKEGEEKDEGGGSTSVAVSKPGFEETETDIRYRVRDPGDFRDDTFRSKKWEGVTSEGLSFEVNEAMAGGVSMILAKLKEEVASAEGRSADSMVMQSVSWAKVDEEGEETGWTLERVKEWWGAQQKSATKHTMLDNLEHDQRHLDERGRSFLPAQGTWKVRKSLYVHILRKNSARQLVTGVVLPCNRVDLQADYVDPDQLLDTMIRFMEKSQDVNLMHETPAPQVKIVECYAAPVDFELGGFEVKEGYWVMTVHVIDAELWKQVEAGEFNGFSIEGIARRVPIAEDELPEGVEVTEEARAAALLAA